MKRPVPVRIWSKSDTECGGWAGALGFGLRGGGKRGGEVFMVLTTGNEAGSATVVIKRPA